MKKILLLLMMLPMLLTAQEIKFQKHEVTFHAGWEYINAYREKNPEAIFTFLFFKNNIIDLLQDAKYFGIAKAYDSGFNTDAIELFVIKNDGSREYFSPASETKIQDYISKTSQEQLPREFYFDAAQVYKYLSETKSDNVHICKGFDGINNHETIVIYTDGNEQSIEGAMPCPPFCGK